MILSDFRLYKTEGNNALNKVFFASVNVTTGMLFWKKTLRRRIRREYAGFWHFIDTGEFLPLQAETLARAYTAQTGEET